ncbi:hypothetical protein N1F89_08815 [Aquibium sp. A9E412]|uniref:hypothetical protein n=1 Tax=Aquibium sp. A9E412 TaxID=2976767 RepID=UPI0025B18364|nr:hypothetical protein [Aquibium sp. A9E412]MDN2566321.1 hypothetical protein [Aquibium sp. A9E412]
MAGLVLAVAAAQASVASERLENAFTKICIYGLPDYREARRLVREAGFVVGRGGADGFAFFQADGPVYGYLETGDTVSCTVHDPAATPGAANAIARRAIAHNFGETPRPWRRDGAIRAWHAPYPWAWDLEVYFGFDDRGNDDRPGGATLRAFFRDGE